jgi:tol-pal system protein YbgF
MKRYFTGAILGAALTAASGTPAFAADKETRQMMADIRILQEQSQQLQNLLAAVTDALKAVNGRIDEQTSASRKSFADQKLVIDTLANDLRVVREKVDDNNVRVGSLTQELDALRQSVTALGTYRPPAPESTDPNAPPAAAPPTGAAAVGASPQKLLDGAMADYYGGQYDLAILGLESYVRTFPQSPQAAFAQANVGDSYFQLGKYDEAIAAYDLVIRNYPRSSEVPDAYVRKGTSLKAIRQPDQAREAFEYVIKNFPDSVAATLAQQRLQELATQKP